MMSAAAVPRLAIRGLKKAFGANVVLRDVNLVLAAGEIHALLGGNGAGKSTLSKILAGIERPDAGTLTVDGQPLQPRSRREAQRSGVVMVLQELTVLPTLTVAENLYLGGLPRRVGGWIDRNRLRQLARAALARVGLGTLDPDAPASGLGIGHQQLVEIAGALAQECRLLILDEPTAALTGGEVRTLFTLLRELRAAGTSILYISHRLDEVAALADRVSVLRDGQLVATRPAAEPTRSELISLMAGPGAQFASVQRGAPTGEVMLSVGGLATAGFVRDVSFDVHAGEIVGLGGLVGAGRTELLAAIFGVAPVEAGAIRIGPGREPFVPHSSADAVARGLAFVPEDRKQQAIFGPLSVEWNATVVAWPRRRGLPGWIDGARLHRDAERLLSALEVRCATGAQPIEQLSGGNQQKIVVGRWLRHDVRIWLLDEPTRGVDVQARAAIHALLRERARDGAAVLLASSDYEELAAVCDRVLVLSNGQVAGEFSASTLTPDAFMAAAFAGFANSSSV